jgi:hypothetical protein
VRLKSLLQILPEEDGQKLGTAVVMRMIGRSGAVEATAEGPILSGAKLARAITDGEPQLDLILGSQKTSALKDLAMVMKEVDPANKVNPNTISQTQRTMSYLANKMAFSFMTTGGMAAAGASSGLSDPLIGAAAGGLAGATVIVPLSTFIGKIMSHPGSGKVLLQAARGDAAATNRLVRSLFSSTDEETVENKIPSAARTRLEGLFRRSK